MFKTLSLSSLLLATSFNAFANQPILVQGAMDMETNVLIEALDNAKEVTRGSWTFWEGEIKGYPVVVSRTEIGLANAAASTTLGIELYNPKAIINQGTSGGHDPDLQRGDIVVGKESFNMGAYKVAFKEKGEGIHPTAWENFDVVMRLRKDGELVNYAHYEGDPALLAHTMKYAEGYSHGKVVEGKIGSADEWNREIDRINWFHETLGTSTEEMETSAAALVAEAYDVPFIGVRVLSNTDLHKQDFDPATAKHCQEFVLKVIDGLVAQYK
ncbi:5'-methylthioadenosine/S-adenosylhomocysteine nucleosidase [Enterovibrio paralichthyis]|uniref:5'-methylthioadenosine/S-adenosylhomocysteine nucleosidase n=1 Tax=Enterovibrio paralichthyis TaxID=2853805 RepID=UPI001C46A54F|nr:5'-methylthioadenosine/S-adenosylhomocysteine nucleosidase [Enterovibrio paralichthyis]MBV7299153.1 5'-methylthioadenosine/S-adenosylhomocysteine nucleosidase [Enterovibrio paralichthyis]